MPIRPTTVVAVEDKLPPKVAAVLINRAHVDRDLVLFLSREARAVYDEIDGHRTIREIDGGTADPFRRLWWRDHVMIDASAARG